MKKVLISVLVSSLLLGAIIAKPKAKVETPAEPAPTENKYSGVTVERLAELFKKAWLPFKDVLPEKAIYEVNTWQLEIPDYYYFWFPGLSDDNFSGSVWGTYQFEVNPYKTETRGLESKQGFVDKVRSETYKRLYQASDEVLDERVVRAYACTDFSARADFSSPVKMDKFLFVWVFSDVCYALEPKKGYSSDRYKDCVGYTIPVKLDSKTGKVSEDFPWHNLAFPSFIRDRKEHSYQEFVPLLEAHLKKNGTAEQLAQWNLIKQEMQSYFAE